MSRAIVFDLDGTLVDSAPDIHAAVSRMLADIGEAPLPPETVAAFVGNGIPALVRRVIEAKGIDTRHEADLLERMVAHYAAHPAELTRPYPGVLACLDTLQGQGVRLGICTNKMRGLTVRVLEALDLMRYFDVVIGGDSLPVRKPDPAPLCAAFDAIGEPLIYVGDSDVDAETAERAGLPFALFSGGYCRVPIESLPSRFVFDDFAAFPGLLAERLERFDA